MPELRVPLPRPVPARHGAEIERRLYFASPNITGFELVRQAGAITEIVLALDTPVQCDPLTESIWLMIEEDVLSQPELPDRVVWRNAPAAGLHPDVLSLIHI